MHEEPPRPAPSGGDRRTAWAPRNGGGLDLRVDSRFGLDSAPGPFGQVSAVASDAAGNVYAFQRGSRVAPIVVFDRDGRYLRSWGTGIEVPHGMRLDPLGNVWITDLGRHQVIAFDPSGNVLVELGTRGRAGAGEGSFNLPTDIAFGPEGDVYVSDGYGNSRIVRLAADGRFLSSWGTPGTGPGQFDTPHSLAVGRDGCLYVSDRGNERIQVFDLGGTYLDEWRHLGAAQGIDVGPGGDLWLITFRSLAELIDCDSLPGWLIRVRAGTGEVTGSMEAPGHWVHETVDGQVYLGTLTGNVVRCMPRARATGAAAGA